MSNSRWRSSLGVAVKVPSNEYSMLFPSARAWATANLAAAAGASVTVTTSADSGPIVNAVANRRRLGPGGERQVKDVKRVTDMIGGAGHLSGELLRSMAKIDIVHVPYKGGGPAMTAAMGGQTQLVISTSLDKRVTRGTVVGAMCCFGAALFDPADWLEHLAERVEP